MSCVSKNICWSQDLLDVGLNKGKFWWIGLGWIRPAGQVAFWLTNDRTENTIYLWSPNSVKATSVSQKSIPLISEYFHPSFSGSFPSWGVWYSTRLCWRKIRIQLVSLLSDQFWYTTEFSTEINGFHGRAVNCDLRCHKLKRGGFPTPPLWPSGLCKMLRIPAGWDLDSFVTWRMDVSMLSFLQECSMI